MTAENKLEATHTAELVAHIVRLANVDGHVCDLTSAQWAALRFFGRAGRFSRTVSAFADYHATTRGSASQTVKGLVAKDLATRTQCENDKRSCRIDLTEKGRLLCDKDPFEELVRAIAALPKSRLDHLTATIEDVSLFMSGRRQAHILGTCLKCRSLKEHLDYKNKKTGYFCVRVGAELSDLDLNDMCMKYRPKKSGELGYC